MAKRQSPRAPETRAQSTFDAKRFLTSGGAAGRLVEYAAETIIFSQREPADSVFYIQSGEVKLSVVSDAGKEAVMAMLGRGDFFGEGCLAGQPIRIGTATALALTSVV